MPEKFQKQTWDEMISEFNAGIEKLQALGADIDETLDRYSKGVTEFRTHAAERDTQIAQAASEGLEQTKQLTEAAEAEIKAASQHS